jgi:NADH dehydrogenase FAD-containing subunit
MTSTQQIVIVGGGFTGLFTALHLSHQNYPHPIILIDRSERFCFKPLLYEYFSSDLDAMQVVPRFIDLLKGSGVTFVQDTVESIDLAQKQVKLTGGKSYDYNHLVLGLGSVTSYAKVPGAEENALPFWTQKDAIAIDNHLRECLRQAVETEDLATRQRLLTIAVIGGGPSGVEMTATLADFVPTWYSALNGNPKEVRVVLLNHGDVILKGDVNSGLQKTAEKELQKRTAPVEMLMGAKVTGIHPDCIEYQQQGKAETLPVGTIVWTAGSTVHPLIKNLPIPAKERDERGRLLVSKTMQLADFPEVFVGGDCAVVKDTTLPATAQVAYQQGATIAHNLHALACGKPLKPVHVSLRGTLLKLGLDNAAANIFDTIEINGEIAHLIRQATYLELLPTPIHNFQATSEWLKEDVVQRYMNKNGGVSKTVAQAGDFVNSAVASVIAARKLLQKLGDDHPRQS